MSLNSDLLQPLAQFPSVDSQPLIISGDTLVTEVIARMSQRRVSCALIVEQQGLVGIFTEGDVVRLIASGKTCLKVAIA